jgi:peptide methionine sulfoxide reductase msrA/msrB
MKALTNLASQMQQYMRIETFKNAMIIGILLSMLGLGRSACGQENRACGTTPKVNLLRSDDVEWKKKLSNEQYFVLRQKGTEAPFSGELLLNKEEGVYKCAGCGNDLFSDEMKFEAHCGWPSFDREISGGRIKMLVDTSFGMLRTEIQCAKCEGHLGHLFEDGQTDTKLRYCVNSTSLEFVKKEDFDTVMLDTITLGGGCYWCVEAIYELLEGVIKVDVGFSGGQIANPTYKEVCSGKTGHAEVVQIIFDSSKTTLDEILHVFFTVHDPTSVNRQGADIGTQYRSIIFYRNEAQYKSRKSLITTLNAQKVYDKEIVTKIEPLGFFYKAFEDHQDYYQRNKQEAYCKMVIQPKIEKFEKVFKERLKK